MSRRFWLICLAAIIGAGIVSRLIHTGQPLLDKYLGDALYAAMVYAILQLTRPSRRPALLAMAIMTTLELFQLTMIPARLLSNKNLAVQLIARLLGTQFSFYDLAAYAVGIGCLASVTRNRSDR